MAHSEEDPMAKPASRCEMRCIMFGLEEWGRLMEAW